MNVDSDTLRQVFDALDKGKRGYITVEQFTSALEKFYTSVSQCSSEDIPSPKITRMQSMDVNNIVNALDPQKDGIISFEDFQSAFQNFFNCDDREELKRKTMTLNLSGRKVSITPEDYVVSPGMECDPDLRTEDSGFLESGPSESVPTRPTTLHTRSSIHSIHDPAGSPFSGSRSDLMLDDVDSNFEQIRQQMRQMEAKMESMSSQASVVESDNLTGRLRDENVRLSASVAVLEERLKETESRYRRDLESERAHLESLMARSKRTYEEEIENLRGRFQKLEADLSATTAQLSKTKVELDGARAECKRTTEALIDAQDKVNALTEQLNNRSSAENWELQKAIADRDQAINALREVNTVVGGGHKSSTSLDTVARLEEMQQLILRLKQDNKRLTKQVQDAQEESWFNNLRDGQKLLYATESSVSGELDKLTKEEVVDLLTQEKHTNNVLRTYLNSLLEKVVINHPELLESKQ